LLCVFLAWRLIAPLHIPLVPSIAGAIALFGMFAMTVIYPLSWFGSGALRRFARRRGVRKLSHLSMAFGSILLTMVVARDLLWLATFWFLPDSIALERWSSIAAFGLSAALFAWGWIQVRLGPKPKHVRVPISNLPKSLSGFRIVQLSDLHIGESVRREHIEKLVLKVNTLGADLIAITGDLVDGSVAQLGVHAAPLANLESRSGTFFVAGNHEHYSGLGEWLRHLPTLGFTVLLNEHRLFERDEDALLVAGVDDYSAARDPEADVMRSLAGAPEGPVRILLAHHPKTALAAQEKFDLQLSGHTHGGQFLPWNFASRFVHMFTAGLYRVGSMWLYVSRGTFYWGPAVRVMAPAEITVIDLA
jgi:predicted MPP superfamily phosphohydrolase